MASIFRTIRRYRWLDSWLEALIAAGLMGLGLGVSFFLGIEIMLVAPNMPLRELLVALVFIAPLFVAAPFERFVRKSVLRPWLGRSRIVVGSDGVLLVGSMLERFMSFRDLTSVAVDDRWKMVVLTRVGGAPIRIRVAEPEALAEAIRAGMRDAAERPAPSAPLDALRGANASIRDWIDKLKKLTRAPDYRTTSLSPDMLVRIAEDPDSDAEQRIGAAIALAKAPEPLRVRVRVAAEATARPHVGEAMKAALEAEELDAKSVKAVERALRT